MFLRICQGTDLFLSCKAKDVKGKLLLPSRFESLISREGIKYEPAACWKDVYFTLRGAKKLICITGWAVWDKLHLFREEDKAIYSKTLGELLIEKANEGVKVRKSVLHLLLSPLLHKLLFT